MKSSAAAGCDHIQPKIVKAVAPFIAYPLNDLINLSISTGVFPDKLKIARVTPIFKSGDKTNLNNYRPISVLPFFSKIFEKAMYNRLMEYIEENNLINEKQYGFRQRRSTYMALIDLIDSITEHIENKKFCMGVFIDLSKAFDTLDHEILLGKLEQYGIRGIAHLWFKSYLSDRQQLVQFGDIKSTFNSIRCGVPQGSILGPLLFLLYINDIANIVNDCEVIMFADDTNMFLTDADSCKLIEKANLELGKLSYWFKLNKLSLNIKKKLISLFCVLKQERLLVCQELKLTDMN